MVSNMEASSERETTLYSWAYRAGIVILKCLIMKHGGTSLVSLLKDLAQKGITRIKDIPSPEMKESLKGIVDSCEKKFRNVILTLRSELLPEKFKREVVNYIIEVLGDCTESISIREEIKVERQWTIDEFYRYSTAILSGFFDALQTFKQKPISIFGERGKPNA